MFLKPIGYQLLTRILLQIKQGVVKQTNYLIFDMDDNKHTLAQRKVEL